METSARPSPPSSAAPGGRPRPKVAERAAEPGRLVELQETLNKLSEDSARSRSGCLESSLLELHAPEQLLPQSDATLPPPTSPKQRPMSSKQRLPELAGGSQLFEAHASPRWSDADTVADTRSLFGRSSPFSERDATVSTPCIRPGRETADLERWRLMMQDETRAAAKTLRAAVDNADFAKAAVQLAENRKVDRAEIGSLRGHVEELLKLNRSLRQTTMDYLTTDEFKKLTVSVSEMTRSIAELMATRRKEYDVNITAVADEAASKAITAKSLEGKAVLDLWGRHFDRQNEQMGEDDERWTQLGSDLGRLRERLGQLEESSDRLAVKVRVEVEEAQSRMVERVDVQVKEAAERIATAADRASRHLSGVFLEGVAADRDALRKHAGTVAEQVVAASGASPESPSRDAPTERWPSVECTFQRLDERLCEWGRQQQAEAKRWRDESMKLFADLKVHCELDRWRMLAEEAQKEQDSLKVALGKADKDKQQALDTLKAREAVPASDFIARVQEIERRGHLKVELRSGDVELLKGLEFASRKPTDAPVAAFSDEKAAEALLKDVAEVALMFKTKLVVEGHAKMAQRGAETFWERLTQSRADLVVLHLEGKGVARQLMVPKGLPGKKGLNKSVMIFKLDI